MLVAIICTDKAGALETAQGQSRGTSRLYPPRPACCRWPDRSRTPKAHDERLTPASSMLRPDMAEAEAWAAGDPYAKAGLVLKPSGSNGSRR